MTASAPFFSVIDYTVDGPRTQQELVAAFADIQNRRVRFHPGYRGARFLVSTDGTRVYNIVEWESEEHWRRFDESDDMEVRLADIGAAVAGVSGWAEPRMSGAPRYLLADEVSPGPPAAD